MNISAVIPVYIENFSQIELLKRSLNSIREQTALPNEVIISDNSLDKVFTRQIKDLIDKEQLGIKYFSNLEALGAARNTNFAVEKTCSDLVHILHQDDYIINSKLYEVVSDIFSKNRNMWLMAQGKVGDRILDSKFDLTTKFGFNELGGPSSLFVLKENYIPSNSNYRMLFDVVNYHEYYLKMGDPYILKGVNIQFSEHKDQLSKKVTSREVLVELSTFIEEYNIPKHDIILTTKLIKREIHHQRLLLVAGLLTKRLTLQFFSFNYAFSCLKSLKRRIFN
jgi:glycosyltransferase involved in cell wall biosynthesis